MDDRKGRTWISFPETGAVRGKAGASLRGASVRESWSCWLYAADIPQREGNQQVDETEQMGDGERKKE